MSKDWVVEWDGRVLEALPAGWFKVQLNEVGTIIRAKKSWKMNQAHISIIPGDGVKIELNTYDMNQWRITFRYNESKVMNMPTAS